MLEFNSNIPPTESRTIKYNPEHLYDGTQYYGASLLALRKLGYEKGYSLVYASGCLNAFFIRNKFIDKSDRFIPMSELFQYPFNVEDFCRKWKLPIFSWYNRKVNSERGWVNV